MGFCNRKGIKCEHTQDNKMFCEFCYKNLPDIKTDNLAYKGSFKQDIIGTVDTKTGGKAFAIGIKDQHKGFVLNFGEDSCVLLTGLGQIDFRKFNFDEFEFIEINGNRFVREK